MRRFLAPFLTLLLSQFVFISFALPIDTLRLENLHHEYQLTKSWCYQLGDNPSYAQEDFDDSAWHEYDDDTSKAFLDSAFQHPPVMVWFRYHFFADSTLHERILSLKVILKDACEIYFDGKQIKTIGKLETGIEKGISGFSLNSTPLALSVTTGKEHVIALRYSHFSVTDASRDIQFDVLNSISGFEASIRTIESSLEEMKDTSTTFIVSFFSGIFITLSLFHFILFLFYRSNRTNLYYSLFTLLLFIIFYGIYKIQSGSDLYATTRIGALEVFSILCTPLLFIALLYQIFYKRILFFYWILATAIVAGMLLVMFSSYQNIGTILIFLFVLSSLIEILRVYIKAWKKKKAGAGIFLFGILVPPVGVSILAILAFVLNKFGLETLATEIDERLSAFFGYSMLLSVSISMTIYLAKDFSRINLKLSQQLNEIKHLFQKTVIQENERKKILENQKAELERKVHERTSELEQKNRNILDNLHYAQRIQSAILPEIGLIYQTLTDSFIFYRPKDIVSGDFYTFSQKEGKVVIAAADCTGHGVTGAFLSMIGVSLMNQLVNERGYTQPAEILNHLNSGIVNALQQNTSDLSDGMDIAICTFDLNKRQLEFAGANRPLYLIRNGKFEEVKADKLAIGGFRLKPNALFTNHQMELEQGDIIYLFTDGFADQFGGESGKKMLSKRLRELLISMQAMSMREQEIRLSGFFDEWKGTNEQVDDVLLIGIRV